MTWNSGIKTGIEAWFSLLLYLYMGSPFILGQKCLKFSSRVLPRHTENCYGCWHEKQVFSVWGFSLVFVVGLFGVGFTCFCLFVFSGEKRRAFYLNNRNNDEVKSLWYNCKTEFLMKGFLRPFSPQIQSGGLGTLRMEPYTPKTCFFFMAFTRWACNSWRKVFCPARWTLSSIRLV